MRLTAKKRQVGRLRMVAGLAACVVLGAATAISAVALRVGVDAQGRQDKQAGAPRSVPPGKMQANLISKVNPTYPPDAKAAGIQGTVVLDAVIDKMGNVDSLKATSGPSELQQSSLDAVRQWRYKPFLWNGEPIEVETTISVVYSLEK